MNWKQLVAVILVFNLAACSPEPESDNNSGREQPFNLQQIKTDYKGQPLQILDVSERQHKGRNSIAITLSVPLNPAQNHQKYFSISTSKGAQIDGSWQVSRSGKRALFSNIEPNSKYKITIEAGLSAATGAVLAQPYQTEISSRDLQASLNFDTKGVFLSQGLGKGIPISAVNIEQATINFYRIDKKQMPTFLQDVQHYRDYYWEIDQLLHKGELVYTGRYDLKAEKNTRIQRSIDTRGVKQLNQPGLYLAVMTAAGAYDNKQLLWFAVTDLGLHARYYQDSLDIYIASLATGQALADIEVGLIDKDGQILQQLKTDTDGKAHFQGEFSKVALITAQQGTQFSVIENRQAALDLSEFDLGHRPQLAQELFIYSPRDLYRPGELIHFNALLRDGDGRSISVQPLQAELHRPDGSVIKTFTWFPQQAAYFHKAWQLPSNAPLGNWQLVVKGALKQPVNFKFKVEEFLPERMKLSFNNEQTRLTLSNPKQTLQLPVLGEYLYGAPAAANRLSSSVNISLWRQPLDQHKLYIFGDEKDHELAEYFELDDIQLDPQGQGLVKLNSRWGASQSPLKLNVVSSLYEAGGRPVSRAYASLVWPKPYLLGIRPEFTDQQGRGNAPENSRVNFDFIKANIRGELATAELQVKLVRLDRQYFWVHSRAEGWHYQWSEKDYVVEEHTVRTGANNQAKLQLPLEYGRYRLEVRDNNDQLSSSFSFFAGEDWYSRWQDNQQGSAAARPDRVKLALDQSSYKAGDTAKLSIVPPQAGEALVLVEDDKLLWLKRLYIPASGASVEIPVSEQWRQHNSYISVVLLRPGDNRKAITPKRSFGLLHLPFARDDRRLSVELQAPDKIEPEKTLDIRLKLNNTKGKTFVTVAAVDVGVLNISNFKTPDPYAAFFGQRRYEVEAKDIYHQLIEVSDAQRAMLRFGGDADLSRGGEKAQSEVQIVSLFSGLVEVEQGEARVQLQLPDFNGRLRLMALAFNDDSYGSAEKNITVAAPVVTQISMPRFLAYGDKAEIALDIHNLSGAVQDLKLNLQVLGPLKLIGNSEGVILQDQQKRTLRFQVEAQAMMGQAQIKLDFSSASLKPVTRQWSINLRPPYPAQLISKHKLLGQGETFQLQAKDIASLIPNTVEAMLSLSANADLKLNQQLNNLLQYPYGCLEQTSSRAFPLLFASQKNQQRFGLKSIDSAKRVQMIATGIDRIASMQLNNGGYGLWSNDSNEEHWLTAYVADFLISARDMGHDVPKPLLDKTLQRLQRYLNASGSLYAERWSQNRSHYRFAYKAYAGYVLSRVKQAQLGSLRRLYDKDLLKAKSGLPQMHIGLALINMGDNKRGQAALATALATKLQSRSYLGDYGSPVRDMALMVHLLMENKLLEKQAVAMSFQLAELIADKQWLSTQERNALFLAGIALEKNQGPAWQAELLLGASRLSLQQASSYRKTLTAADIQAKTQLRLHSKQPLYASALIRGYSETPPKPVTAGFSVQRRWYNSRGEPVDLKQAKVGDLYIVRLSVKADKRSPDALLVDLLPAGFELENQNLEHAIKLDDLRIDGKSFMDLGRHTDIKFTEYRDDRFVAALNMGPYREANVFYLLRAVTPGSYTLPPSLVEDMYRPARYGIGQSGRVSVSQ